VHTIGGVRTVTLKMEDTSAYAVWNGHVTFGETLAVPSGRLRGQSHVVVRYDQWTTRSSRSSPKNSLDFDASTSILDRRKRGSP